MTPKPIKPWGTKHGNVVVPYEELQSVVVHLSREHGITDKCEAVEKLRSLISLGVEAACAENMRKA